MGMPFETTDGFFVQRGRKNSLDTETKGRTLEELDSAMSTSECFEFLKDPKESDARMS